MRNARFAAIRTSLFVLLLATVVTAAAQHPLAGSWLETQIGFVVTFEEGPGGQLAGTLTGQAGPMPLNLMTGPNNVQGTFQIDGTPLGFAAELQPDGATLMIWLFEVDFAGQAVPGTYEQYVAFRQSMPSAPGGFPAQPPVATPPAPASPTTPPGFPPAPSAPTGTLPATPPSGAPTQPGFPATQPGAPATQPGFPAAQPQQADIVGSWRLVEQFDDGTQYFIDFLYAPNGSWRMVIVIGGEGVAEYGGNYTLSPAGVLTSQETGRSPQLCFQGNCQPNATEDTSWVAQLSFQGPDSILAVDLETGDELLLQRIGAGNP